MVREVQYLSIDTKTKFIETLVAKIQVSTVTSSSDLPLRGQRSKNPPLVGRVTKNTLVKRGIIAKLIIQCF